MEKFRIEWHDRTDGYLELIVDRFFPCIAEKSKKVFKLVAMYCSDEAIDELQAYLEQKKADAEWKGKNWFQNTMIPRILLFGKSVWQKSGSKKLCSKGMKQI